MKHSLVVWASILSKINTVFLVASFVRFSIYLKRIIAERVSSGMKEKILFYNPDEHEQKIIRHNNSETIGVIFLLGGMAIAQGI